MPLVISTWWILHSECLCYFPFLHWTGHLRISCTTVFVKQFAYLLFMPSKVTFSSRLLPQRRVYVDIMYHPQTLKRVIILVRVAFICKQFSSLHRIYFLSYYQPLVYFIDILFFWKKLWVYSFFFHSRLFQHMLKETCLWEECLGMLVSSTSSHLAIHVLFCIPPPILYLVCLWEHEKYMVLVRTFQKNSFQSHCCWTKFVQV